MIQFRCKNENDIDLIKKAKELSSICKSFDSLLIINDRVDIAIACNADGVHLGQDDLPVEIAKKILGSEKLIGLSTHSQKQIKNALTQNCDYLGIGPIYKTSSKTCKEYLGIDFLKQLKLENDIPWFAIGGINCINLSEVKRSGVKRIAVINAIMNAKDPYLASKELLESLK